MIAPHGTEHPHGTAHTLYRVIVFRHTRHIEGPLNDSNHSFVLLNEKEKTLFYKIIMLTLNNVKNPQYAMALCQAIVWLLNINASAYRIFKAATVGTSEISLY